jgi:hypothetical protein
MAIKWKEAQGNPVREVKFLKEQKRKSAFLPRKRRPVSWNR